MSFHLCCKTFIQLSSDWWGHVPSLLAVWAGVTQPWGCLVGLMVASRRPRSSECLPGLLWAVFFPHIVPKLPLRLCKRPSSASRQTWPSHRWDDYSFLPCPVAHKIPCVSSKSGVSFSPGLWKSCSQIPLALIIRLFADSSSCCPTCRLGRLLWGSALSLQWERELMWCSCFPLCVSPSQWAWDSIVSWLHFSSSCPGFPSVLGCRISFLVGSSISLSVVVQQIIVIPVFLWEGVSTSPSLQSWANLLSYIIFNLAQHTMYYVFQEFKLWCNYHLRKYIKIPIKMYYVIRM